MFATILASIIAVLIYFRYPESTDQPFNIFNTNTLLLATFLQLLPLFILALAWTPLQKAEQNLTPRVSELFKKDWMLRFYISWMFLFPLASFFIAIDSLLLRMLSPKIDLMIWIVLFGITLDVLYHFIRKVFSFLDPFAIIKKFSRQADRSIQNDKEFELCQWVDGLSEISIKAIDRMSLSLASESIDTLQQANCNFLIFSKGMGHSPQDAESRARGISDKVSYTLFFILQKLEMINEQAAEKRLEPLCSKLVTALGKIVIASGKYDLTLTTYPLHFLGRSTATALNHGLKEVGPKAVITLTEIAKAILTEIDITYLELQTPFLTLIAQMQMISREIFRRDKTINIKMLIQPFLDLKAMFSSEKMATHPDTKIIILAIDDVLAEFTTLEAVMKSIPPIPVVSEEKDAKGI